MFRARFTEAFPKSLPNFGPQELERDVVETIPGERVEQFLCALLSLLLNRKQDVKYVFQHLLANSCIKLFWSCILANIWLHPGPGTTIAHSRRPSKHTRANGLKTGMLKTLSPGRLPLLP